MNHDLDPPERLGRYEILAEIGQGMMGVVYKARDPVLGRPVALKVMRLPIPIVAAERAQLEQRFLLEANMAASLSHPNIVVVHDVGRDPVSEAPFMALEYLEGQTLAQTMARGGVSDWRDAVRLTAQLADALHHAHNRGIVHRDVKPANIMVVAACTPKILDFGIAKVSAAQLPADGQCWGTPSYMSPEQAAGAPVDGRSDLFSLGSVLYELLTRRRAFAGANIPQIMTRVAQEHPEPPSRLVPSLPAQLDTVILRALSKDPAQRYANGRALVEDLEDVLQGRELRPRPGLAVSVPKCSPPKPQEDHSWVQTLALPKAASRGRHAVARVAPWALSASLGVGLGFAAWELGRSPGRRAEAASVSMVSTPLALVPRTSEPEAWIVTPETAPVASPTPGPVASIQPMAEPDEAHLAPSRSASTSSPAPPAKVANARVALSVEHGFKRGWLRVWVDDTLVLEKPLAATQSRSVLFFTRSRGSLAEVLEVTPGERMFRVEVEGDEDQHRGGQLPGVLRTHETRLLEVKVGGQMQLGWKS